MSFSIYLYIIMMKTLHKNFRNIQKYMIIIIINCVLNNLIIEITIK